MKEDSIEERYDTLKECVVMSKSARGLVYQFIIVMQLAVTFEEQTVHQMAFFQGCMSIAMLLIIFAMVESREKRIHYNDSSNLCREIIEYTSPTEIAVCNLASIALPRHARANVRDLVLK